MNTRTQKQTKVCIKPMRRERCFNPFLIIIIRNNYVGLLQQKLSHAVKLLMNGHTVTEACMRAGFSDCSHFTVLFKKAFGMTPLQYKRKTQ